MRAAAARVNEVCLDDRLAAAFASCDSVTVIDVGAFHGEWSRRVAGFLPVTRCLLIEPNPDSVRVLRSPETELPAGAFILDVAIAEEDRGSHTLFLTKNPVGSSLRAPESGWQHEWTHVDRTSECSVSGHNGQLSLRTCRTVRGYER